MRFDKKTIDRIIRKYNKIFLALQMYDEKRILPFDNVKVTLNISREVLDQLKKQKNMSRYLECLARKDLKIC
jgi:hypothetical protein